MVSGAELNGIALVNKVRDYVNENKIKSEKIGLLYNKYCESKGGNYFSFKTFQRIIDELRERELIQTKKIVGGAIGRTTLISSVE